MQAYISNIDAYLAGVYLISQAYTRLASHRPQQAWKSASKRPRTSYICSKGGPQIGGACAKGSSVAIGNCQDPKITGNTKGG